MTWDAYHRRNDALRKVAVAADERRDGVLPWGEYETSAAFDSRDDLLLALHMRWHNRLRAYVHVELDEHPLDLEAAASRSWRNATADMPGTRAILDSHDANPALAPARTKELAFLAEAAGMAHADAAGAEGIGQRIQAHGQAIVIDRQRPTGRPSRILRRLRQAVAA